MPGTRFDSFFPNSIGVAADAGPDQVFFGAGAVTTLVADHLCDASGVPREQVCEVMTRADPADISVRRDGDRLHVRATFGTAMDATRAAADLVDLAADSAGLRTPRVAIGTAKPGSPPAVDRLTALVEQAGVGQVLVTAATAILAGPALPCGLELYYRGRWRAGAGGAQQPLYELRRPAPGTDVPPANLHWARRALAESAAESAAATQPAVLALSEDWRRVRAGELMMALLTAAQPRLPVEVSAELALRLHAAGTQVLYGRWERENPEPLQALREALGVYADRISTRTLRIEVDDRADVISCLLPEVGVRLGLPQRSPELRDGAEAIEAIEGWLTASARRHPTLLVLHDLHPDDRDTARLLTHLRLAARSSRIMLLITATEPPAAPALADLLAGAAGDEGTLRHLQL
ncbi:hypothetical protein JQS43_11140 [Natronosporangium hydrolyticum]|uniref:Uncharacterized protein n=1 Tax=Natronosporangium hydrolyticum TaxID=2811111 RepID=A0A895YRN8_9ACTN|nr:hypothetical protein [Natronosporangium hydrolyticum]QSB16780.1 hypothetical protein JQS43_11140 [Natronosporangium hydrolyticum]